MSVFRVRQPQRSRGQVDPEVGLLLRGLRTEHQGRGEEQDQMQLEVELVLPLSTNILLIKVPHFLTEVLKAWKML